MAKKKKSAKIKIDTLELIKGTRKPFAPPTKVHKKIKSRTKKKQEFRKQILEDLE